MNANNGSVLAFSHTSDLAHGAEGYPSKRAEDVGEHPNVISTKLFTSRF